MEYVVNKSIVRILREKGMRQKDAADRAGMDEGVFSNIVRCRRKVYADEVIPIARAIGVSIEELFRSDGVGA